MATTSTTATSGTTDQTTSIFDSATTTGDPTPGAGGTGDGGASGGDGDGSGGMSTTSCPLGGEANPVSVYILANASNSLNFNDDLWTPMKEAVLAAVESYQDDYDFGFGTFVGTAESCDGLEHRIDLGSGQFSAIETEYESIVLPEEKTESPVAYAVTQATERLSGVSGDRYILLITDDAGDFCDDSLPECAQDATTAALQLAAAAGIRTLVASVDFDDLQEDEMNYLAQAGWGQEPAWDIGLDVDEYSGQTDQLCEDNSQPFDDLWNELRDDQGQGPNPDACGANQPTEGNADCHLPAGKYSEQGGTATAILGEDAESLASALIDRLLELDPCAQ